MRILFCWDLSCSFAEILFFEDIINSISSEGHCVNLSNANGLEEPQLCILFWSAAANELEELDYVFYV